MKEIIIGVMCILGIAALLKYANVTNLRGNPEKLVGHYYMLGPLTFAYQFKGDALEAERAKLVGDNEKRKLIASRAIHAHTRIDISEKTDAERKSDPWGTHKFPAKVIDIDTTHPGITLVQIEPQKGVGKNSHWWLNMNRLSVDQEWHPSSN